MLCPQCGHRINGRALFCPHCGIKLESGETRMLAERPQAPARITPPNRVPFQETQPPSYQPPVSPPPAPVSHRRQGCGLSLAVILIGLLVMALVIGLGVAGIYFGLQDRTKAEHVAALEHYQKGRDYWEKGELELAVAEMELAVELDPDLAEAQAKLQEAEQQLQALPSPTAMLQQETKGAHFEELQRAYEGGNWPLVFQVAERLLALDPTYRRADVDKMLFEAFHQAGLQAVEANQLAEAVRLFDRALALQPENITIQRAKYLASLYLTALSFWESDWGQATQYLDALYLQAPEYKDVGERAHVAHVNYGDVLMQTGQWCDAAEQYQRAINLQPSDALTVKQQQATKNCQTGAPVPEGSQPGGNATVVAPSGPSGTFVANQAEYTAIDSRQILVRGRVLDRNGDPVPNMHVQIGAWDWKAVAITDGSGQYAFDGLKDPVTFTLTLQDAPSQPFDVAGVWGKLAWVDFRQVR
jgi:tetratricopeptide (TPR) repeat protein